MADKLDFPLLVLVALVFAAWKIIDLLRWSFANLVALTMRPGKDYYDSWRWRIVRGYALWRDHNRCQMCRTSKAVLRKRHVFLDVHHIVPVSRGGSHFTSNLVAGCRVCHAKIHGRSPW